MGSRASLLRPAGVTSRLREGEEILAAPALKFIAQRDIDIVAEVNYRRLRVSVTSNGINKVTAS